MSLDRGVGVPGGERSIFNVAPRFPRLTILGTVLGMAHQRAG
jgi:hypothetical protein